MRRSTIAVVVLLVFAGCGDDDSATTAEGTAATIVSSTTTTTATETIPATAPSTTVATTAAPTTTPSTTTTTTEPPPQHPHPEWGIAWEEFVPSAGAVARYSVFMVGDAEGTDTEAVFEEEVEFQGGTWSAVVFGDFEAGRSGSAIFMDLSEPWLVGVKGVASTSTGSDSVFIEAFDEPVVYDLSLPVGESTLAETTIQLYFGGEPDPYSFTLDARIVDADETIDIPLGSLEGTSHLVATIGGSFSGGDDPTRTFDSNIWLHPEHFIVRWVDGPGFFEVQMIESWS